MIKLYLLRHARPAPPLVQTADVPLAESGLAQAKAIVPILASLGIQRIRTPAGRAWAVSDADPAHRELQGGFRLLAVAADTRDHRIDARRKR